MSWSRKFHKPLHTRNGKTLKTLSDARAFLLSLGDLGRRNEWQHAAGALLSCAKSGRCRPAWEAMRDALFLNAMLDVTKDHD